MFKEQVKILRNPARKQQDQTKAVWHSRENSLKGKKDGYEAHEGPGNQKLDKNIL